MKCRRVLGADVLVWLKVKAAGGEGFVRKDNLESADKPFSPDDELAPDLRRNIRLETFAAICFNNAFDNGSNSSLLMAIAFAASGDTWTNADAIVPDKGEGVGIYRYTREKWRMGVEELGDAAGIRLIEITSSAAQCNLTALITGSQWQKLEFALARPLRGVDLLLAFLTSAETAAKLLALAADRADRCLASCGGTASAEKRN